MERLSVWHEVLAVTEEEQQGLAPGAMLLIDPDSRLSQLGVLPLIADAQYFFFDSRSRETKEHHLSMAQMANAWVNLLTGTEDFHYPKIWPKDELMATGRQLIDSLRLAGAKRVIVMNFGVGGNHRKRVGIRLEAEIMRELLATPDTVVLLDKGFGEEELAQTEVLLSTAALAGHTVQHAHFEVNNFTPLNWGVIGMQCGIGEIAALIAQADEYIGYDSACQHLAAALGTPCLTLFAGSNNTRFIRRWSPFGHGPSRIIHIDTLTNPAEVDVEDIMCRLRHARKQLFR
jgi:ADP-heptose:LPS heptosyltransferase